jgi:hypothetical protein
MKTYGVLDGGEWSALRPCRFIPGGIAPITHWVRGWMDPRAGLDAVRREISCCSQNLNLGSSARSPLVYQLGYPDSLIEA